VLADVSAETDLSLDTTRMFAHPDGLSATFPMNGGRTRFMFQVAKPEPGTAPTLEQVQNLVDQRMGGQWKLTKSYWLTYFEIHHGQIPQYRSGHVLLGGDAAHIHSPAGGQGMNTGIQAAVNLSWKLALVSTGRAHADLLDSYQAERHPVGAAVIKQTNIMTEVMAGSGAAAAQLRSIGLFLLGHSSALGDAIMSNLAEVTINYQTSPIVQDHGRHRAAAVHPGDHLSEVAGLAHPDGTAAFLGDLLRRPGHVILLCGHDRAAAADLSRRIGDLGTVTPVVSDAASAAPGALVDAAGALGKQYGTGDNGIIVVRPDGYVGMIAHPADNDAFTAYRATISLTTA
jgi:hypothetical protein